MLHYNGLKDIVTHYEGLIIDLWGVIHDGSYLYPDVINSLQKISDKKILFLSNNPSRSYKALANLKRLGILRHQFIEIITSGETVNELFAKNSLSFGRHFIYIGPERHSDLLESTGHLITSNAAEATFALVTGFYDDDSNIARHQSYLQEMLAHNLTMICANPDLEVVKLDGSRMLCAGVLAQEYQKIGGAVIYIGKPYQQVYDAAIACLALPKEKLLAIGDGLETDIKGANLNQIDSALITGGILKQQLSIETSLLSLCEKHQAYPTFILPEFRW